MKLSRYNIEKKEDKSCLIYNTVTSAILEFANSARTVRLF